MEVIGLLRALAAMQDAVLWLRILLFLLGLGAAASWLRSRPRLTAALITIGGLASTIFWAVQVEEPLGLAGGGLRSREWAQAGVIAAAPQRGDGFVFGTPFEPSATATMARLGFDPAWIFATPQIALLALVLITAALPWLVIRNRRTAAFASVVTIGGGFWPGMSGHGSMLKNPEFLGLDIVIVTATLLAARSAGLRRLGSKHRFKAAFGLVALAACGRALGGGVESGAESFLLVVVSLILASPARVVLRAVSGSAQATRVEAAALVCLFTGSGLFWWNPIRTDPAFAAAREPAVALREPLAWIAKNVPADGVVIAAPGYSTYIAAVSGRRVLFQPTATSGMERLFEHPGRRERLLVAAMEGYPPTRLATAFSATHLLVGPGERTPPVQEPARAAQNEVMRLVRVYEDARGFQIFQLTDK